VLLAVVLLLFGPKRLPELGRSLGSGLRGFRQAMAGDDEDTPRPQSAALSARADRPDDPAA
jgi:sec-independent protein translocase protein TatA